jgi:hypothetical protein
MDLTPSLVLAMWTAGVAGGAAAVAQWRVVGPGYVWLTAGTTIIFGGFVVLAGGGGWAIAGVVASLVGLGAARTPRTAAAALAAAAVAFALAAWLDSPLGPVVSGAVFVGGITSEMMLGHWYLVDPRLPRWALYRLAAAGGVGLGVDAVIVVSRSVGNGLQADAVFAWAYAALAVMTGLLVAGVWFSLREPRYTGVMAATGLSYLAVLTSLGVLVVGRMVAWA